MYMLNVSPEILTVPLHEHKSSFDFLLSAKTIMRWLKVRRDVLMITAANRPTTAAHSDTEAYSSPARVIGWDSADCHSSQKLTLANFWTVNGALGSLMETKFNINMQGTIKLCENSHCF